MKLITKIKNKLNDVFGIIAIGKNKTGANVYILAEEYRLIIFELLKANLSQDEFERVKIIVTGPVIPAED